MTGIDLTKLQAKKISPKNGFNKNIFEFLNKDISFGDNFPDKKKESFYLEVSILLNAGVDIKTTLELVADEQEKKKDKILFEKIKDDVIQGVTLSEALKNTGKFSPYEYFSLQIGEESGKITTVLNELAEFYKNKIKQRRQVISALTYPAIVLCTSLGAVFFMMNFIVPMFADIFKRFGGDLPVITATIIQISQVLKEYFLMIFIIFIGIIGLIYSQRKKTWFRKFSSTVIIKLPIVGTIIRKIYLARFCHSMTLLIGSKIPILRALSLTEKMVGFYLIANSIPSLEKQILQGKTLHESLNIFPIYDKRMISLLKVGEEVNQLEMFFDKIAKQYSEDVEHQTTLISSMIEPFMIIFLGLIVGVILIAMYLPLFQLSSTF